MLLTPAQCLRCRTYCDAIELHRCPEDMRLRERTPDGLPQCWLLYSPEPHPFDSDDERSIHLWVRRCEVFTTRENAIAHLDSLLGQTVRWRKYDPIFPELWIGMDARGYRWLMVSAPVDPPGRTG